MKLLVGLGNPGPQYAGNRHNIGFHVLDREAEGSNTTWKLWGDGHKCELAQTEIEGEKAVLLKPLTYMNNSGMAVVEAAMYFRILPQDICVVHDELDLSFGDVRLKVGGGDGGHNGLKSISQSLSSTAYARIRMGIGRPPHAEMEPADYVLQDFARDQLETVADMIDRAIEAMASFAEGTDAFRRAMNEHNKRS